MSDCKNCGTALAPMTVGNERTSSVVMSCPKGCGILAFGADGLFDHVERARVQNQSVAAFRIYHNVDGDGDEYISVFTDEARCYGVGKTIQEAFADLANDVEENRRTLLSEPDEKLAPDALRVKRFYERMKA